MITENNMKNWYGFDRLTRDMLILAIALGALAAVFVFTYAGAGLMAGSVVLTALALLRCVSTRRERRQDELLGYEKVTGAITGFFAKLFGGIFKKKDQDPNYCYFRCPDCRQRMRAPKGKGRIRVTCSHCGKQFERKV